MALWVKICANTSAEDALAAAELGADAVGFVFAPSVRRVTAREVRAISAELPESVERVGVFGAASAEEIAAAAETARLTTVQLHGGFDPQLLERLTGLLGQECGLIQTVHWTAGDDEAGEREVRAQLSGITGMIGSGGARRDRVLVDTKIGTASGGTGVAFSWSRARGALHSQPGLRTIVAGGLRPENVAEAVRTLTPWGVDVASGVEREPGKKDFGKLRAFLENARGAC